MKKAKQKPQKQYLKGFFDGQKASRKDIMKRLEELLFEDET